MWASDLSVLSKGETLLVTETKYKTCKKGFKLKVCYFEKEIFCLRISSWFLVLFSRFSSTGVQFWGAAFG